MVIGAIIQARMSSTRLYGKILLKIPYNSEMTVLEQVIKRVQKVKEIHKIIIATTENKEDDVIIDIANKSECSYYRGSENNVLSRYYYAAKDNDIDIIVRITSDDPCIDPEIITDAIKLHIEDNNDYTANHSAGLPLGLNVEILSFSALEKAFNYATESFEKEHVSPYINRTKKDEFRIGALAVTNDKQNPEIRVTLDTELDYAFICAVYDSLYQTNHFFGAKEIVQLLREKPWMILINKSIVQKRIYNTLEDEWEEALRVLELNDLKRVKNFLLDINK